MDSHSSDMLSLRPYIIRAFYQWICDSEMTPFLVINTDVDMVEAPKHLSMQGHLTLDISPDAVDDLEIQRTKVTFIAYFDSGSEKISIPMRAIVAIFASENEEGIAFAHNSDDERLLYEEEQEALALELAQRSKNAHQSKSQHHTPRRKVSTSHLKIVTKQPEDN
ncbi:MAG: hypothetical protein FJ161_01145 [Gammaproteobacteria bacterium]|nr:hypothetical protein [Gammaproteobacteria bacterium]